MLEDHIAALSKELAISEGLKSSFSGVYLLPLGAEEVVTIAFFAPEGFTLSCALSHMPKEGEEAVMAELLKANLFGKGTRGATLGLSISGEEVVLNRYVNHYVDYKTFRDYVEDFINTADFWKERLLKL